MIRFLRSVPRLDEGCSYAFPPLEASSPEGIVCAGGNLTPGILLSAYRQGIFPWYEEGGPILWWSPDPRFVILPETFHIPASAHKLLRHHPFRLTADRAFRLVMESCASIDRPGQDGTWIVPDMIDAYVRLHELGYAHSVEAWEGDRLAGGLYGLSLGGAFFGESMFSKVSGASRVGFLSLALALFKKGFVLIDSQVHTDYLAGMGGVDLPRGAYMHRLGAALQMSDHRGSWVELFGGP
ncbi:MAG: leucyl/phenylalanyl-tRNA--protein transferase [Spirochaetae bacterium HGW-Spirochaetae-9]|nr:MAG: leucyl/phenylalanyl-tRNA--protein transferase [Spirochaetae bacterium HGW-Spirochaetae-9]